MPFFILGFVDGYEVVKILAIFKDVNGFYKWGNIEYPPKPIIRMGFVGPRNHVFSQKNNEPTAEPICFTRDFVLYEFDPTKGFAEYRE